MAWANYVPEAEKSKVWKAESVTQLEQQHREELNQKIGELKEEFNIFKEVVEAKIEELQDKHSRSDRVRSERGNTPENNSDRQ